MIRVALISARGSPGMSDGAPSYSWKPACTIFSRPGTLQKLFPLRSVFDGNAYESPSPLLEFCSSDSFVNGFRPTLLGMGPWSWGWRGGWGPRVGVYLGPGPWGYDPYYYDPYYGGYPYYYPNAYYPYNSGYAPPTAASQAPEETQPSSPDNSRHDLKFLNRQIARARDQVDYEYEDGDISRAEHNAEIHRLSLITKHAHAAAKANCGYLTRDQEEAFLRQVRGEEPPMEDYNGGRITASEVPVVPSGRTLQKVNGEITRLRALLDKKLADGDITKAQRDGMNNFLDRIDQHVHSDAASNGGTLTADQEGSALQQLRRANDSINQNFVQG